MCGGVLGAEEEDRGVCVGGGGGGYWDFGSVFEVSCNPGVEVVRYKCRYAFTRWTSSSQWRYLIFSVWVPDSGCVLKDRSNKVFVRGFFCLLVLNSD